MPPHFVISPPDAVVEPSPQQRHVVPFPAKSPAKRAASPNYPAPATYFINAFKSLTVRAHPLPASTQSPQSCDSGTEGNEAANTDAGTIRAPVTSGFPVYGPFDLLKRIQKGAFGSAWAARDNATGRIICLKAFLSLTNKDIALSVKTELRIFRHMAESKGGERGKQFIMELSRSIHQGTTVYFAMELMATDLATYLSTSPERCKASARRWMAQLALGIQSLHDMGIIHRDIKPENILIDSRENVCIVDFGLCYIESSGKPLRQGVDYADDALGTLSYMAPEVLRNKYLSIHWARRYGKAVDWWALGCILFELESEDHQILFDEETDLHKYITWTQKPSQLKQTYTKFKDFDPMVVSLLEGLLQVQPSARFSLSDMEKHEYFFYDDDTSEFDDTAAQALDRPVCPNLVPTSSFKDESMESIEAATLSSAFDWVNPKWARTTHVG